MVEFAPPVLLYQLHIRYWALQEATEVDVSMQTDPKQRFDEGDYGVGGGEGEVWKAAMIEATGYELITMQRHKGSQCHVITDNKVIFMRQ